MGANQGEGNDRGNDNQGAGKLHHGGEVSGAVGEGVACSHHRRSVVDCGARPEAVGHVGEAQGMAHNGEENNHGHVEDKCGAHGIGHVQIVGFDDGGDGGDGAAAANPRAGGDEIGHLPVQSEEFTGEVADAEAGKQGKDHDGKGQAAHLKDRGHV